MVANNSYEFPNGIVLANIFCRTACKIDFQNNIQKTTSAIIKSHNQCENNVLKFCLWHKFLPLFLNLRKKTTHPCCSLSSLSTMCRFQLYTKALLNCEDYFNITSLCCQYLSLKILKNPIARCDFWSCRQA